MKAWLKHFFVPHEGNNYAPHSLQKVALFGMLFLVVLTFTASNALSLLWMSSQWMVSTILPAVIVEQTNKERSTESLGRLQRNETLDKAAQLKANDMAKNEYFAHYSPTGVSPWHWFDVAEYNFVHAGENLAIHFTDSDAVVKAWMESPTHRQNIMNGNYTQIGIGTAEGEYQGFKTIYVVQLFGTPAQTMQAVPKVAGEETKKVSAQPAVPIEKEKTEVLAEAVSITETVTYIEEEIEQEPVSIETDDVQATGEKVVQKEATTSKPITKVVFADMEATSDGAVLYSDFVATTTNLIPATVEPILSTQHDSTPLFYELTTQPHRILQYTYIGVALFVLFSLLLSVGIEIKHQQPLQIVYSLALLLLMFGLFSIHSYLTLGVAIV